MLFTGCKTTITGSETTVEPNGATKTREIKIEQTYMSSLIRSASEQIASATGFSATEWQELDVSAYQFEVQGSFGLETTIGNTATVDVISAGQVIGSNSFSLTQVGNLAKFSNPSQVKAWAIQFTDIADAVEIDIDTTTKNLLQQQGIIEVKAIEGNQSVASASYSIAAAEECGLDPSLPTTTPELCVGA